MRPDGSLQHPFHIKMETVAPAELERIRHQLHQIMSAISDFAAKQTAFNDRQGKAIDDLAADITALNDLIKTLQTSAGQISPEDQATLDQLTAQGEAVTAKIEKLDSDTPPTPPTP